MLDIKDKHDNVKRYTNESTIVSEAKPLERHTPKFKQFTGSSVRNSQAKGEYFRKVLRSPRPMNVAKKRIGGKYIKVNNIPLGRYTTGTSSKMSKKKLEKAILNSNNISASDTYDKNMPSKSLLEPKNGRNTTTKANVTLDICQNYYGTSKNPTGYMMSLKRRSHQNSSEKKKKFSNRINSLEVDRRHARDTPTSRLQAYSGVSTGEKPHNFPQVKLSTAKLNIYKYQKHFYRFGQFGKLVLPSKQVGR